MDATSPLGGPLHPARSSTPAPSASEARTLGLRLRRLAADERGLHVEFLHVLEALDRCRGYAELGYPSLWEYCLRALHLREGATARRIGAMRALRRFPQLSAQLADGRLCLSTLAMLAPVLTPENVDVVAARAAHGTRANVEAIVAGLRAPVVPRDGVRKVAATGESGMGDCATVALTVSMPLAPGDTKARGRRRGVRPVGPGRATACGQMPALSQTPAAAAAAEAAATTEIDHAPECAAPGNAARDTRTDEPRRPSRYVPSAVRREVWARDQGRCTFVAADGTRCNSRWQLELDHVHPYALGGATTAANLRLRCREHNLLHAERVFGRARVARCIDRASRSPSASGSSHGAAG